MRLFARVIIIAFLLMPAWLALPVAPIAASHLQTNASATTTAALNLREGPRADATRVRVIPEGERVFVVSGPTEGHWYEVTYQEERGYVLGDYLAQDQLFIAVEPEDGPPGTTVTIYGSGAEPNEETRVLAVPWSGSIPCDAPRGADPIATVRADETGRWQVTHAARRLSDEQRGWTYVADKQGQPQSLSNVECFAFAEQARSRFFPETGHTVSGEFLTYWERHGGLAIFGYPISDAFREESLVDGQARRVQYFERQRFELHPENEPPYNVLLGHLGWETLPPGAVTAPAPSSADTQNCMHFGQTGHNLCHGFRAYWQSHGLDLGAPGISFEESVALFGYPITEEFRTTMPGTTGEITVQYFERARFEWHPDNPEPYRVLLGHLGREVYDARGGR